MELFAFLSYVVGGLQQPTRKQVIGTFNDAIGLSYHGHAAKCSYKNVMIRTVLLFLRSSPAYGITGIIVGSVWNWKNFRYIPGHGRYHACWDQESAKIFHLSMYSLDVTMSACNVYIYWCILRPIRCNVVSISEGRKWTWALYAWYGKILKIIYNTNYKKLYKLPQATASKNPTPGIVSPILKALTTAKLS